jgi:predicted membrane-bound spermidine synthase
MVTEAGRRYLGLGANPRVSVATDDGRVYLETHPTRYDAIFLDAYQQPYIPFQLTTQEFWSLVAERLDPGGIAMANLGRIPNDDSLARAIAGTAATRFASVYLWHAMPFNDIMLAFTRPTPLAAVRARLARVPPKLVPAALRTAGMRRIAPSADPLTDDRAPVEWMTDQMIVQYAGHGSG